MIDWKQEAEKAHYVDREIGYIIPYQLQKLFTYDPIPMTMLPQYEISQHFVAITNQGFWPAQVYQDYTVHLVELMTAEQFKPILKSAIEYCVKNAKLRDAEIWNTQYTKKSYLYLTGHSGPLSYGNYELDIGDTYFGVNYYALNGIGLIAKQETKNGLRFGGFLFPEAFVVYDSGEEIIP